MEHSEMTRDDFMAFFRDDNCSFFKKKGSIFSNRSFQFTSYLITLPSVAKMDLFSLRNNVLIR